MSQHFAAQGASRNYRIKEKINKTPISEKLDIVLTYITSRGKWYAQSWKGNIDKYGIAQKEI